MATPSGIRDHQDWLGYLQPEGLVVSPTALANAQVILNRGGQAELQESLRPYLRDVLHEDRDDYALTSFLDFARGFLGWQDDYLLGLPDGPPLPAALTVPLPDLGETLAPTLALRDPNRTEQPALLLVQEIDEAVDLDRLSTGDAARWSASAAQRFERLLRETGVPIGIVTNRRDLRLVYAPRGESAGSITWPLRHLAEVSGRPLVAALHLLLNQARLLTGAPASRLPALLTASREAQSSVSTALAGQVLQALYELLRGLQTANNHTGGELLRDELEAAPDDIYAGLLTVMMRLVFLLYAEDRGLLPSTALYRQHYGLHGLYEQLRTDAQRYPDTMDQRHGAWARFIALCDAVHAGCGHPELQLPARAGHLFDPDRYPFLRGATLNPPQLPLVPDSTLYHVLAKLLILRGERLSYRTLDVEEIGSVYQTIMGFALQRVAHTSIAVNSNASSRSSVPSPVVVDLEALLALPGPQRATSLQAQTGLSWTGKAHAALPAATTTDELLVALGGRIARYATPHPLRAGDLTLQPTDERRRTGSHYTPRQLTGPIVRRTLAPILAALGPQPTPAAILDLKICDPAVGSGAFLVEACRQLADALVAAWDHHGRPADLPAREDDLLTARRAIAQRCLYGVDRNPLAVDLAKLSLWLATLASDQPFTFLDHTIRPGDSLVGLEREQIVHFAWDDDRSLMFPRALVEERVEEATAQRRAILAGGDLLTPALKADRLRRADDKLDKPRAIGDLALATFFGAAKPRDRKNLRATFLHDMLAELAGDGAALARNQRRVAVLAAGPHPITPFHWEIEFPEVFGAGRGGFDAIVGNPPFLGGKRISTEHGDGYRDWLAAVHEPASSNTDLVAHFFRRAFTLLRPGGCFGLIASNTIAQGDTREGGLRWICTHGGTIYAAERRYTWPGEAAVVVSVVHVTKGAGAPPFTLDGRPVPQITAYLFHAGGHDSPARLAANANRSYIGCFLRGMGFTFDDTDRKGVASSLAEMERLIAANPRNAERIFPYLGGEEVNTSPTHAHHRYVINFEQMCEPQARQWPHLMRIVEQRVKPERDKLKDTGIDGTHKRLWWRFANDRPNMMAAIAGLERVLVISRVSKRMGFALVPSGSVWSEQLVVFPFDRTNALAVLQCRLHEEWARFFMSTLGDGLRYTPSDCFETFPFPLGWEVDPALERVGAKYERCRAKLMVARDEGLTTTYNRFHDPNERDDDIAKLRAKHAALDAVVLAAYGWDDLELVCGWGLDYPPEELDEAAAALLPRDEPWWPSAEQACAFAAAVGGRRRLPWRHRWPAALHDELLARLLALNAERAAG